MSTRSNIGIINADGSVTVIYTHSDGYPDGVGKTLREHYNTEDKVRELLKLGDLSVLGEVTDECIAYGRDRGEKGTKATKCKTIREACSACDNDYTYFFNPADNQWSFRSWDGPFQSLTAEACK